MNEHILSVENLAVGFQSHGNLPTTVVDDVSFAIRPGETFALLGESGSGKSLTALAIMQLLPSSAALYENSHIALDGEELENASELAMRAVRGKRIAMIFQEPMTSLNPVLTVEQQIGEVLTCHFGVGRRRRVDRIVELLDAVGIPDPRKRLHEYPHQLSGGMKQRVMIAMALAGEPELLIADEPTTALDVTIQAQVLDLMNDLKERLNMGILLITHDLGVVRKMADRVAVMYAGQIIEARSAADFFSEPKHPYSKKLFDALPTLTKRDEQLSIIEGSVPNFREVFEPCRFAPRCPWAWKDCHDHVPHWSSVGKDQGVACHLYNDAYERPDRPIKTAAPVSMQQERGGDTSDPALHVTQLKVHFPVRKGLLKRTVAHVKAVDGVDLTIQQGKTLALVGESGCGKTTVAKGILRLIQPTEGSVRIAAHEIMGQSLRQLRHLRKDFQIIFQDPYSSLNPRMMVADIIGEGLTEACFAEMHFDIGKEGSFQEKRTRVVEHLMKLVGLTEDSKFRYPHEFSGGQRQRIGIARALAVSPKLLICDEPTSALDVSVQAQILNLLQQLQNELGLAYLFITHNIAAVSYLADDVAVMYLGRIVERGPVKTILNDPKHPYTQALLSAVPEVEPLTEKVIIKLEGELPSPMDPPKGCHFNPRCPHAMDKCRERYPGVTKMPDGEEVRCFLYGDTISSSGN